MRQVGIPAPDASPAGTDGVIGRLVRNRVTPNVLMLVFLGGGFLMSSRIKQEVFPEFELDVVAITVPYPGASPEEVERGILLSIEEAVRGIDGVKDVRAVASEGSGRVNAELEPHADAQRVYQDIQQQVNRIRTFPLDAEDPVIALQVRRREVLNIQVYGATSDEVLRELAEQVRDRLLQEEGITQVEFSGARNYEIHVEVPQERLRRLGLRLEDVARAIRANAVEVPGGSIETRSGEILLRVRERRDWAREFAEIPLLVSPEGSALRLGEVADVREGFEEVDVSSTYDGQPSIGLEVYRVGKQTPMGVSRAVRQVVDEIERDLPPGVNFAINRDRSEIYQQRLELLLRNGFLGLMLVLLVLGLFLDLRLAFWVTLGIPISFLGALLFLPIFDVTINMISLFAFIIALGIVVDDAIVAGENIYARRESGMGFLEAAIQGARDVSVPIGVAIVTNIVAFAPLLFVPGTLGKTWFVIPVVVSTVFLVSWVEALVILPAHLAHGGHGYRNPLLRVVSRGQQAFSRAFLRLVDLAYRPFLALCVQWRYLTLSVMFVVLGLVGAYGMSGRLGFILMPKVESDQAVATARLPYGSPPERVEAVRDRLVAAAQRLTAERGGDQVATGVHATVNEHQVQVNVYMAPPDVRLVSTAVFTDLWREAVGEVLGVDSLRFESDRGGPGGGAGVTVQLAHRDIAVLDQASARLAEELSEFAATRDVDPGYAPGKRQLDFTVRPEGRSLGLDAAAVARQVRDAFHGSEALRQQRGRSEVKVLVRLPLAERGREHDVEKLLLRTPQGGEVPLREVAEVEPGRAYTTIDRRNGRRTVNVTADVIPPSETQRVLDALTAEVLPRLAEDFPGLAASFEGRQQELRESLDALLRGLVLAVLAIYVIVAIPFRSYVQPVIVMIAIPFGVVGAVIGHQIMGYELSIISLMGIVALAGVVVNDSVVMVDLANRLRRDGATARQAILDAGLRRFRPILLTTLTTFGGLSPMIFETSRQARFMIPMAISLGYGILFATAITLVLVPTLYLVVEDLRNLARRLVPAAAH